MTENGLELFLPPVRAWFEETFGRPTPPQAQGWPAIQRGEHTLILAPTGSGKTLAAFLWGIDRLFHELTAGETEDDGVRLVYISPLKALNNDIQRNLRAPLAGIRVKADELGQALPSIRVAVRSGDTPQRERQAMLRQPPHILITTPESLYLLLTSPKAREMFRTVRTVIVDEIHTLAGNKRGVHLSLSLERLAHLTEQSVQRIGLSATIQPLDEVARFLGGSEWRVGESTNQRVNESANQQISELANGESQDDVSRLTHYASSLQPRPVTVVDAAYRKDLDVQVVSIVDDFRSLPGDSVWPSIIPQVLELIESHKTTLVFTNNRRLAERAGDYLNEQIAAQAEGRTTGLIKGGVVTGRGMMATGDGTRAGPIRVHHGSVARETRLEIERQLKAGELPALVGTSSLELGIDIGEIDLVVQLQSPKSVAQALQRVGRSGHLVGQTSKGRIFPTHREDVVEAAAIAGGMLRGEVEPTHMPRHPLDVLAQQIVAMISVETWEVDALFDLVRRAYAYNDLSRRAFLTTLEMLAGRYPGEVYRELRARLDWDRVNDKLAALPGSRMLALTNGGTIPDTGAFGAYLSDGKTKLGELDEEFVFETRIGDTMMLGSQVWRVIDMTDDRVVVAEAPGATPRMPFWRGDLPWRPYELGQRVGAFRSAVAERLEAVQQALNLPECRLIREHRDDPQVQDLLAWLGENYALDARSAWHTVDYLSSQIDQTGAVSSDRTVLIEVFEDALGDARLVIHSPFGGRVNGPWGLALAHALRERQGIQVEVQTNDEGVLLRLLDSEQEFPLDIIAGLGPDEARERILSELPDSAVFGTRFRQNAARALLLPGRKGKRTPFWLQRLRARDLLQIVRQFDDFPIVAETYRDCLQDVLDLPHLEQVLGDIQSGKIEVVLVESTTPSPVAQSLLWDFVNAHMYEWDAPRAEQQLQLLSVNRDLIQDLLQDVALDQLLRSEAIEAVRGQLQHTAPTSLARTAEELAVLLGQVGDLASAEIAQRASVDPAGWIARLSGEGRLIGMDIPTARGPQHRWVIAEYAPEYAAAFPPLSSPPSEGIEGGQDAACQRILTRFLNHAGPVTLEAVRARYAFPEEWLKAELARLVEARQIAHGRFTPAAPEAQPVDEYVDRRALEQIHRRTLGILRREVQPVPLTVYADFLARWQHVHPAERLSGEGALVKVLQQLRAQPVVGRIWERDVLPGRLADYRPAELDALCQGGELVWIGCGGVDPRRGRVRFLFRGEGSVYLEPAPDDWTGLGEPAQAVYGFLKSEGAVFFGDICAATEMKEQEVEAALIELVMAGLATNDSLTAMRRLVEEGTPQQKERKPLSALEEELARRRSHLSVSRLSGTRSGETRKPAPAQYRAAKGRVRARLGRAALTGRDMDAREPPDEATEEPRWGGRWAAVHRFGVLGKPLPPEEQAVRQMRQLLARYGVVTHECLSNEAGAWNWGLIFQQLQRLEMRGEVRRGYFVQGLPGLQFALPEVVERLRALRDQTDDSTLTVLNACDPTNLFGPALDDGPLTAQGEPLTFARLPSTWLVQGRGLPLLVAANGGANMITVQGADDELIRRALLALLDHLARFERRVSVETWNGEPVLDSAGRSILEAAGFYRSYPAMVWERRW